MSPPLGQELECANWIQDETFVGTDARIVRRYDDVILSRAVPVSDGVRTNLKEARAGTTGTVLFVCNGEREFADLELDLPPNGFGFGLEQTRFPTLHMTIEEKYAR